METIPENATIYNFFFKSTNKKKYYYQNDFELKMFKKLYSK